MSAPGIPFRKGGEDVNARVKITEAAFQRTVIEYAQLCGWRVMHTRAALNSKGEWSTPIQGDPGFPDLTLARRGVVVFAELKSATGRVSSDQREWLDAIGEQAMVWTPDDWPVIERLLK